MKYTTRNENKIQKLSPSPTFDSVHKHIGEKLAWMLCKKRPTWLKNIPHPRNRECSTIQ